MASGMDYLNLSRGGSSAGIQQFSLGDAYQIAGQREQLEAAQQKRRTIADIGLGYQSGGIQGARDAAFRGGEVDTGLRLTQEQRQQADAELKTLESFLTQIDGTSPEQYQSIVEDYRRRGSQLGPEWDGERGRTIALARGKNLLATAQRRLQQLQITGQETTNAINAEKLADVRDPNRTYERRAQAADRYAGDSLAPRERNEFIMTGDFPRMANQPQTAESQAEARRRAATQQGLDPADPHVRQYILTGKFPREDQAPLTATDKKAILEADEAVLTNRAVIDALTEAERLNPQTNTGWTAGARAVVGNNLPDMMVPDVISSPRSSEATSNYENLVLGQALTQLKTVFGAAPTEGERKILVDLQASVGKPVAVRKEILARAKRLAEARLKFNEQRAEGIRGQTYYKPQQTQAGAGRGIAQMGLEDLQRLDPKSLSPAELQEAARRYDQLVPQP